jgi:lysophospholipase L1-like esterase
MTAMTLQKLRQFYRSAGVMLLNTIILFLLVNALLFLFFSIKDSLARNESSENYLPRDELPRDESDWGALEQVYPDLNRAEIITLLKENARSRFLMYEPFTEFRERPVTGKYVNVDSNGFRLTKNQGPWPPEREKYLTAFLFGGSTTFGVGVPDDQTIASYLQALLATAGLAREARVYNFGQGGYYSTQERIFFEKLITAGRRPEMAIFIDGLNDAHRYDDRPASASRVEEALAGKSSAPPPKILIKVPMVRAALAIRKRLGFSENNAVNEEHGMAAMDRVACHDEATFQNVINRYVENKKMIETVAAAYGVKTAFVWQPVPLYEYEQRYNLFPYPDVPRKPCVEGVYRLMAKFWQQHPLGVNFLYCAEMQENAAEPLYVDTVHYSGKMSSLVAKTIFDMMRERNLLPAKVHAERSPDTLR